MDDNKTEPDVEKKPSAKQEIIVAIAALIILGGAIAGGMVLHKNLESKDGDLKSKTTQDARGYTLTPPEGWKKVSPTPEGASVAFAAPNADSDTTGALKPFIAVQSAGLKQEAKSAPFDDIAMAYSQQLAQAYTDFELLSSVSKTIGSDPAMLITFRAHSGKAAMTQQSLFMVKDGISYTINGGALTSAWDKHMASIEQSLLTFRP